jgi:hypothetical protein
MFVGQATEDRTYENNANICRFGNFYFRKAFAREVIVSPIVPFHRASTLAEHRAAQLESAAREGVVLCTTRYVTTTRGDGSSTTRKSVNCEE